MIILIDIHLYNDKYLFLTEEPILSVDNVQCYCKFDYPTGRIENAFTFSQLSLAIRKDQRKKKKKKPCFCLAVSKTNLPEHLDKQ